MEIQDRSGMPHPKPKNYLVESIISTVLCCVPLGIVAIIQASKVDSLYAASDFQGAQTASDNAKKWALIGAVLGFIFGFLYLALIIAGAALDA